MEPTITVETSLSSPWIIQTLPAELLDLIMLWGARIEENQKNNFLPRRLLCKAFDKAIRPLVCKGIQLETTMFMRSATAFKMQHLVPVAHMCEAIYLDLMVVRDEEEASSLIDVFQHPHPMQPLSNLFRQYCMGEHTFDEMDFRSKLVAVIEATPNLKRMRINLPVQIVGPSHRTSTLLLATTLSALANNRPEEHKPLETLVIDHLTETTIKRICHNHMDLTNCLSVFHHLQHLILSLKRNRIEVAGNTFAANLWYLLRQACNLQSLCLIGWNDRKSGERPRAIGNPGYGLARWQSEGLPYHLDGPSGFRNLRFLELKLISIEGPSLIKIISETATSLKELYLNEVYLKIHSKLQGAHTPLWIGHLGILEKEEGEKGEEICWIADALRNMKDLKLDILRVSDLGYDDFEPNEDTLFPDYDLESLNLSSQSFDQRFVDAVIGDTHPPTNNHPIATSQTQAQPPKHTYDLISHQKTINNPTSTYKTSIDGLFLNHNDEATKQIGAFIEMADKVMGIMTEWVANARRIAVDERSGTLVVPVVGAVVGVDLDDEGGGGGGAV